jgi:hypothetical protein
MCYNEIKGVINMFEDLIVQLDELGVTYTEDYDAGTLTIDIADVDKSILIDVIMMLNDGGYMFDITESTITVEGGVAAEEPAEDTSFDEEAYLDDAFAAM